MTNPHQYGVQGVEILLPGTTSNIPWRGVKELQLDTAHRNNYKVYNDGILYDYLTFGYEAGVNIVCYDYPSQLENYIGRRTDPTGIIYDGGRSTAFGLIYRTEREDGKYNLHYVPRVMMVKNGDTHKTVSETVEPTEFSLTGEAIPVRGTRDTPSVVHLEIQPGLMQSFYQNAKAAGARFLAEANESAYGDSQYYISDRGLYTTIRMLNLSQGPNPPTEADTYLKMAESPEFYYEQVKS